VFYVGHICSVISQYIDIFEAETAQQILDTPLFLQVNVNRLVWKAEKNGHYTVRSTYRLCMEEIVDHSHLRKGGFWCGIWKLKVPPRLRIWCGECVLNVCRHGYG